MALHASSRLLAVCQREAENKTKEAGRNGIGAIISIGRPRKQVEME